MESCDCKSARKALFLQTSPVRAWTGAREQESSEHRDQGSRRKEQGGGTKWHKRAKCSGYCSSNIEINTTYIPSKLIRVASNENHLIKSNVKNCTRAKPPSTTEAAVATSKTESCRRFLACQSPLMSLWPKQIRNCQVLPIFSELLCNPPDTAMYWPKKGPASHAMGLNAVNRAFILYKNIIHNS